MPRRKILAGSLFGAACVLALWLARPALTMPARHPRLLVAVTSADIEAIVKVVGAGEVDTFRLFHGCILRRDLLVDEAAMERLSSADAIVWTGLFNESSAIHASIEKLPAARKEALGQPAWIDVSRDAARINVPTSTCEGYVELQFMPGDPFFWLNPRNGAVIARNVAEGLGRIRPDQQAAFIANAEAFSRGLDKDIARWERELRALSSLKVFSAQCGWRNFSQLGGPTLITCRKEPGALVPADVLAAQVGAQDVDLIMVDPNTPPEYAETFRRRTKAKVLVVPSSIADLAGATTYSALFDNLIRVLNGAAQHD